MTCLEHKQEEILHFYLTIVILTAVKMAIYCIGLFSLCVVSAGEYRLDETPTAYGFMEI